MKLSSVFYLLALAAIWGGSFLFMRVGAPVLGSTVLIEARVGLAAVFLLLTALYLRKNLDIVRHWKHFLIIGFFNSALPFFLFAYSALTITASLLSILNATAPIWGAVIGAVWHRKTLSPSILAGLCLGVLGVSILVGFDSIVLIDGAVIAIVAALGAAFSYGIASVYAQSAVKVASFDNAHGSMWAATLIILPFVPFFPVNEIPDFNVLSMVLALGIVCTGVACLLYFRLISDLGASSALSVTFLIPVFGIFWGYLFLDEIVGWHTVIGTVFVVFGTALVTGFRLRLPAISKSVGCSSLEKLKGES